MSDPMNVETVEDIRDALEGRRKTGPWGPWMERVEWLLDDRDRLLKDVEAARKIGASWKHTLGAMTLRAQAAESREQQLRAALQAAIEGMQEMVEYVPDFFREKWDMDDYLHRARHVATAAALTPEDGSNEADDAGRFRRALEDLEGFLGGMRCDRCDSNINEAHRRARAALTQEENDG